MTASGEPGRQPWLARMRMDITPLRSSKDFRIIFVSGVITYIGSMITYVAVPFQVAAMTGSYVAVGLIGLVELVPLVVFGLYGGALADAVDRRVMVIATEVAGGALALVLLANALSPVPQIAVLYVVAMLTAVVDGLQRPSLDAMIPRVVAHEQLAAAGALTSFRWTIGSIVGPAIGGLLISAGGAGLAYVVDLGTFAVSILLLWRLHSVRPDGVGARPSMRNVADGVRYAMSRKDLLGTYAVDLIAMAFAFPYALFPFLAEELGAPWALGLLYSAGAVGALGVTLTSGWTATIHRHGRAIVIAAAVWGTGIALVGATTSLWFVLLCLAIAGAADMVSGIFRGVIWNQSIPDSVRGRMAGLELLSYSIGPLLGQVRSSTAASRTSLRVSFVSGGVLCMIGVAVAAFSLPSLWNFDQRTNEHVLRERQRREPQD